MPFVFLSKRGTRVFPTLQMSPFLDAIYRASLCARAYIKSARTFFLFFYSRSLDRVVSVLR